MVSVLSGVHYADSDIGDGGGDRAIKSEPEETSGKHSSVSPFMGSPRAVPCLYVARF